MNKAETSFKLVVQQVARQYAQKYGYDLFFFITMGYRESSNEYDKHEKGVFSFVPMEKLDGALVTPDAYDMPGFREALFKMLDERARFPVVCVRDHENHFDCCYTDESTAIRQVISHLLDDHGFRKVCFQAGYQGHIDSDARLACYYDEMKKRGLPLPPNAVHYGTMWTAGSEEAYQHFYGDPENWPEAVVCANDHMAEALIDQLRNHGYRVPEDTVVTGFDNIEGASRFVPSLTTVGQDYVTMVSQAMELLHRRICQQEQGVTETDRCRMGLPGKLYLRESCGCGAKPNPIQLLKDITLLNQQRQAMDTRVVSQTYFSIELNAAPTYEEIHNTIFRKLRDVPTMRDFYLCMFRENGDYANRITDEVQLISAISDRKDMGSPGICFEKDQLLPKMAERPGEAQVFYFYLLHQRDSTYGYTAIQYFDGETPTLFYQHWNVIISLALRNLDDQIRLHALYEERRLASVTDALTGLDNRRGFDEKLMDQWEKLIAQEKTVCFISLDMDNLKYINDTFGHYGGDEALKTIADGIRHAVPENAIAARVGGDEYLVFIPDCGEYSGTLFRQRLEDFLREKNQKSPFRVGFSMGARVFVLREGMSFSQCIRESDQVMYIEKASRHREMGCYPRRMERPE